MWYVMQVFTGEEEKMKKQCMERVSSQYMQECFIPHCERMKRFGGAWHKVKRSLFPGYLFLITDDILKLYEELKKVDGFKKILGDSKDMIPLSDEEVELMEQLGGDERNVEMSIGIIENDKVKITKGPLMGKEGLIRKIDRHKRTAKLEVEMFGGRLTETTVGLEIVRKVEREVEL